MLIQLEISSFVDTFVQEIMNVKKVWMAGKIDTVIRAQKFAWPKNYPISSSNTESKSNQKESKNMK